MVDWTKFWPGQVADENTEILLDRFTVERASLIDKIVSSIEFWSNMATRIDIPEIAADVDLPDVVVAGLPTGVTLIRVVAMLSIRQIANNAAGTPNSLAGAQAVRIKRSTGLGN